MDEWRELPPLLPENWQEGQEIFDPEPSGPFDPPGGFGTGVGETDAKDDFSAAIVELKSLYPDFTEMPAAVAEAIARGAEVKHAYQSWRETHADVAQRAVVGPVSRGGGEGADAFLLGFGGEEA